MGTELQELLAAAAPRSAWINPERHIDVVKAKPEEYGNSARAM